MKMKTPEEFFNEHYQYPNSQIELCSRGSVIHALKCYKEHLVTDEVSSGVSKCGHVRGSIVVKDGTVYAECRNCGELY